MKYIDADQIRAEIERRRNAAKYYDMSGGGAPIYDDLLDFLDTLPEQPAIEGLEEAAEEYRRNSCNAALRPNVDGPTPEYGGSIKGAFIAGAEWMSEKINGK